MTADEAPVKSPQAPPADDPAVLQQLIDTMEAILEVFPQDVSALESLSAAYQQSGELEKASSAALKLARLVFAEGNLEKAYTVVRHALELNPDNSEAASERDHIAESLNLLGIDASELVREKKEGEPGQEAEGATSRDNDRDLLALDLSGELELGWFMLQKGLISQDQYEAAVEGLTNSRSSAGSSACLSFLIEIAVMDGVNVERILGEISAQSSTPYVDITRFELVPEIAQLIPFDDARRLGVLPFGLFKNEIMVATLNPMDQKLRKAVSDYLGSRTHFFLTSPEQFQSALMNVMAIMSQADR